MHSDIDVFQMAVCDFVIADEYLYTAALYM